MGSKEPVEIACERRYENDKAVLIFDGKSEVWIPKSQIIEESWSGDEGTIWIPEWLAYEKELI